MDAVTGITVFHMIVGGFAIFGGGCTLTWRVLSYRNNGKSNGRSHSYEKSEFIFRRECERVHQGVDNKMSELTTDVKDIQRKVGNIEGTVQATVKSTDSIRDSIKNIHTKIDSLLINKKDN